MLASMIAKILRRDQWPQATATVTDQESISDGGYNQPPPTRRVSFYYRDGTGQLQSGEISADNLTSLYDLQRGDTFDIRYNPKKPSLFYCEEIGSAFTASRLGFWLFMAISFVIAGIMFFTKR